MEVDEELKPFICVVEGCYASFPTKPALKGHMAGKMRGESESAEAHRRAYKQLFGSEPVGKRQPSVEPPALEEPSLPAAPSVEAPSPEPPPPVEPIQETELQDRVGKLEGELASLRESVESKPSKEEVSVMLNAFSGEIADRVLENLRKASKEPSSQTEGTPAETPEASEETRSAAKAIFGRDVSPQELGGFLQGLGTFIAAVRGPPPSGPSPFEEAGKAMFTEFVKTVTRTLARGTAEEALKHEAVHGE